MRVPAEEIWKESYEEAIRRERELQGEKFEPVAKRIISVARQIADGQQYAQRSGEKKPLQLGWSD